MNRALLTALFFALQAPWVQAIPFFTERKLGTFETAPPIPAPVRMVLTSRSPVRIILRVQGYQTEPVTFLLREVPKHGSIWMAPQVSGEWAEVTYTPPQDRSILRDSFKFAVSNSRSTSSESIALIQFQDIGPRLEFPPSVEFGQLRVGQRFQRSIEIKNTGDLAASGSLSLVGPWHLNPAVNEYNIEPGKSMTLQLVFQPQTAGSCEGSLQMGSNLSQSVYLTGKAEDWIEAWPDPLILRLDADQIRRAGLNLVNPTDKQTTLRLQSFPEIEHERSLVLKPGEQISVPVAFRGQSPVENSGKLVLVSETGRERVLLWRTQALAPSLGGLDKLDALVVPRAGKTLRVWNEGGRPGRWALQTSAPFKLELPEKQPNNEAEITLAPGEAVEIKLLADPKPASPKGTFTVASVRHQLFPATVLKTVNLSTVPTRIPQQIKLSRPLSIQPSGPKTFLEAVRSAQARMELPAPSPGGITPPTAILPPQLRKSPPSEEAENSNAETLRLLNVAFLPAVFLNGLVVSDVTHHSVKLSFEPPKWLADQPVTVQKQTLELDQNGQIRARWVDLKNVVQRKDPAGKTMILVDGLSPGSATQLRLLGPPQENGGRPAMHESTIYTLPAPGIFSPSRPWIWLGAVPLAALVFLRNRRLHFGRRRR
jgi:hypothetical protein